MNILSPFLSDCLSKVLMISYFQFIFPNLLTEPCLFCVHIHSYLQSDHPLTSKFPHCDCKEKSCGRSTQSSQQSGCGLRHGAHGARISTKLAEGV